MAKIEKEDLWLAMEMADDDAPDGVYWAMIADMLDCDVIDVTDALAEYGHEPHDESEEGE